ncbi:MAG: hypothetical protein ABMA26_00080 [Limisphaerales bacterium]
MKTHQKKKSTVSNRPTHRHARRRTRDGIVAKPSEERRRTNSTADTAGTKTASAAFTVPTITVPDGWTPQRDREHFDSEWDSEDNKRHEAALDLVADGQHRLGATLIIGRGILLCAGGGDHHAAVVHLPLACQVSLLESALSACPPPDEDRFFAAAKECRIAVDESERILMKLASNPEGTTLWELCAASELLFLAAWKMEASFCMEFDGSQSLFADIDDSWDGETPD